MKKIEIIDYCDLAHRYMRGEFTAGIIYDSIDWVKDYQTIRTNFRAKFYNNKELPPWNDLLSEISRRVKYNLPITNKSPHSQLTDKEITFNEWLRTLTD